VTVFDLNRKMLDIGGKKVVVSSMTETYETHLEDDGFIDICFSIDEIEHYAQVP